MKSRLSPIVSHWSALSRATGLFTALLLSCVVAQGQEPTPPTNTPPTAPTTTTTQSTPTAPASGPAEEEAPKLPNDQLDSLVAPIALYPDPLVAQSLAAATYPLEIVQLRQWMQKNKNLKDQALADAVGKQKWDPSVQALAAFPEVTQRMADNIAWTTDLGNAFLAQQTDVMDAVQRMRSKAQSKGNLKTSSQQKVVTQKVEGNKEVIVIEQADPKVVYVPSYDPAVVYGPPAYPYYPYMYPGYYPGMGLAFGTGLILGAAWNNNWGNCNWGGGDININNNNNFNRNNVSGGNRNNVSGGNRNNSWQHSPQHRGNAPYSNRSTENKYGGDRRSQSNRPSQQPSRDASNRSNANRPSQQPSRDTSNRSNANRPSQQPSRDTANRNSSNRSNANAQQRSSNSIGNHQVSRNSSPRSSSTFSAPSHQMNRSSSFSSQSRGHSSMGGGSRGGGSRGGGRRR